MVKRLLSVVVALAAALSLVMAFEYIGGLIFQHPAVDMKDPKTISSMMASMPMAAFLWILLGYAVSSFAGGLIATLISGRQRAQPAIIVGAILMVGGIMNLIMIPYHPIWFMISDLIVYLPFAWLGYFLIREKT
jgi:hypothetical protein